jgi:hypothetical protein
MVAESFQNRVYGPISPQGALWTGVHFFARSCFLLGGFLVTSRRPGFAPAPNVGTGERAETAAAVRSKGFFIGRVLQNGMGVRKFRTPHTLLRIPSTLPEINLSNV